MIGVRNERLYRDDGVAIGHKTIDLNLDKFKEDIINLFEHERLYIVIDNNLIKTNLLDANFRLSTDRYFLFKKPKSTNLYITSKAMDRLQLPSTYH